MKDIRVILNTTGMAQGLINAAEGTRRRQAQAEIQPLLAVDDFDFNQLQATANQPSAQRHSRHADPREG